MDVTLSINFLVLVPVVLGVVEAIKRVGMASRYAPLASLVLGVAGAYLIGGALNEVVIQGLIAGLSAAGLWSGVKATIA